MRNIILNQQEPQAFLSMSFDQLHKESQNWISEIEFIKVEQFFLQELLSEHIMGICNTHNFKNAKFFLNSINNEKILGLKLIESIKEHKINLALLIERIYLKKEDSFRKNHKLLELDLKNYVQNFKYIKEQVFELILVIMRNEKNLKLQLNK
ncbi:hypothetical protein [Lutibacter sp.]|uniref:hypothetical protein n=1 Tax=Lutibacter sp. TaxID=1925666 RepID=UPI002735BD47|nr:hypothetical protein [Lutibacter sp.]MDP3313257.1 hypothetical protein [Lutibacter sp.]